MVIKLHKGKTIAPRKVLLYGPHGTGKSTFAAHSPNHIFLNFEDGLNDIDCVRTERIGALHELRTILMELSSPDSVEHKLDWLVFDTLDWLENLIHDDVRGDHESIVDIGFGKGYKQALSKWEKILRTLESVMKVHNCGIIALCHAEVKRYEPPGSDSYDRFQPALHNLASLLWQEWCDEVLHLNYRVYTKSEKTGFDQSRTIAFGQSERYIRTQESPGVTAKSRLGLPPEIPCDWQVYEDAIKQSYNENRKGK